MELKTTNCNNNFIVYMHVNKINNKVYVGITQRDPKLRWLSGHGYSHNEHFDSAIKKYGWDNFEHIIFMENISKEEACNAEILLIQLYNTTNRNYGYNMSYGGEFGGAGVVRSEESRKKMSESAKNKPPISQETRDKLSKAHKGFKHTEESRKKISDTQKGRKGKPWTEEMHKMRDKPVLQYDKDGIFMCEYKSIRSAAISNKILNTHISACCRGICPSAGEFVWRYKHNDDFPLQIDPFVNKCFVPVRQYDFDGNFIAEYETSREAESATGINYKDISGVLNEEKKSAGGYMWRKASEYAGVEKINPYVFVTNPGRSVVQLTLDGQYMAEFSNIKEAKRKLNMPNIHVGDCCQGKRPNAGGFKWRYKDEYEKEQENLNA